MANKKKGSEKDPGRFRLTELPGIIAGTVGIRWARPCKDYRKVANDLIRKECLAKNFVIDGGKPCGKGGAMAPVDLVVLIDTSGSMYDEATSLSNDADAAINAAKASCPSDLKVAWFGLELESATGWPAGTKFTKSHRAYLNGIGISDSDIKCTPGAGGMEDGAAGIMDISDHYDWRPNAARAIFYLGDEALEGGDPQNADDVTAANAAIARAQANGVTVFTYFGTPGAATADAQTVAEYERVAKETGGEFFNAAAGNIGDFKNLLEKIICASNTGGCQPAQIPEIRPCFKFRWGDGPKDNIETDDVEIICISACNPYSNITIKGLTVIISVVTNPDGSPVANLPDGSPSVLIKPSYNICFGDIPPCDPKDPDEFPCISREFALITRGAKRGDYMLKMGYCFTVNISQVGLEEFKFKLVKS
jgi:hypothetical protein